MNHKKQRLGAKLLASARSQERYRDRHVFIGGTGAVGGTALLHMLSMYEEMMAINPPPADDVPWLIATGRNFDDIQAFTKKLFRHVQSRNEGDQRPKRVREGYLTPSGVFVALERFQLSPIPALRNLHLLPEAEQAASLKTFLMDINPKALLFETFLAAVASSRPLSTFLREYQRKQLKDTGLHCFRSVTIGIPLPSLVSYHLNHFERMIRHIETPSEDRVEALRNTFRQAFRDDLNEIRNELAQLVLVAHTTAVGGMYDEIVQDGKTTRKIRLGFTHSALDKKLELKQREADEFTREYASIGIKTLITAAAVGIDEVRIRAEIPLHYQIAEKLSETPHEVYAGSKDLLPPDSKATKEAGRPVPVRHVVRIQPPLTLNLNSVSRGAIRFPKGDILRPSFSIRSGENGFFSVANADALYRVMRVASASELGLVLATVGLFDDDPITPWFNQHICYYPESDNSRQVFDLLNQAALMQTQLSGLEPMALQDLGSAKHQAELHTLSLLILLHRLRTLDIDAIDPYVDLDRFDAPRFFTDNSRALRFEDVEKWHADNLAADMQIMAGAETPQDLLTLIPGRHHGGLFPLRDKALMKLIERVLQAIWMIPSLGSPLLYERNSAIMIRTGYFAAPLDELITDRSTITTWFENAHRAHTEGMFEAPESPCTLETFREFHFCTAGFVDLRAKATLCISRSAEANLTGKISSFSDEEEFKNALLEIEPYSFFSTSGLLALMVRLRGLQNLLREAMAELGTLPEFRWQMPRDRDGHILVVPGAVEAFRMISEGMEKTTGTERLDGIWGYWRRPTVERWHQIPGISAEQV